MAHLDETGVVEWSAAIRELSDATYAPKAATQMALDGKQPTIQNGDIVTSMIADGAIVDGKLDTNSVNDSNIKNGAVSTIYTVTIPAEINGVSAWKHDAPPYVQEVACVGLVSGTAATYQCASQDTAALSAFALCTFTEGADSISASSSGLISVDIPIDVTQNNVTYTITLLASDWEATGLPYRQDITVNGLLTTDHPIVDLIPSDNYATAEAELSDWVVIYKIIAGTDTLSVFAQNVTVVDLNIQILCVRK